jgi:hypothetical protein
MMDEEARLRLECLRLADAARKTGDRREVLLLADAFLRWVKDGTPPRDPGSRATPETQHHEIRGAGLEAGAPRTIKDMIRAVLNSDPSTGRTALEILDAIRQQWQPSLQRWSLSPQLSRLKAEGLIVHKQGLYRLAENEKEDASPEVPDEAP